MPATSTIYTALALTLAAIFPVLAGLHVEIGGDLDVFVFGGGSGSDNSASREVEQLVQAVVEASRSPQPSVWHPIRIHVEWMSPGLSAEVSNVCCVSKHLR